MLVVIEGVKLLLCIFDQVQFRVMKESYLCVAITVISPEILKIRSMNFVACLNFNPYICF
jgi:hypothetical protein